MLVQSSLFGFDRDGKVRPTCPHCGSTHSASDGKLKNGGHRYICRRCSKKYQDKYAPHQTDTTKLCARCKQHLPLAMFKKREPFNPESVKRQTYCDPCQSAYHREHYLKNTESYKQHANNQRPLITRTFYSRIWSYLASHHCVDCGESDPIVLEFDHRDDVIKVANISGMVCLRWEKVVAEIAKCDVRCANCHRRRTAKQFNWYVHYLGVAQSAERLPSKQEATGSLPVTQS